MSAKRLVPLRRRGTEEQRYARIRKSWRRGHAAPHLGINWLALHWRRQARLRRSRPRLASFVNITITRDDDFGMAAAVRDVLLVGDRVPYTDDGIAALKQALLHAIQMRPGEWAPTAKDLDLGVPPLFEATT